VPTGELLREAGELKVGDIAAAFSMSLNGVSKHLKVLEKAGFIERRVDGREHWIRVSWASLQQPYEWLHFYHHFWSGRLFHDRHDRRRKRDAAPRRVQDHQTP
jgi:DNA-binding transcriptional ArsR family regulator